MRAFFDFVQLSVDQRNVRHGRRFKPADAVERAERTHVDRHTGDRRPEPGPKAFRVYKSEEKALGTYEQVRLISAPAGERDDRILHVRRIGPVDQHQPTQPQRDVRHVRD
jgi:hypothetical protein